MPVWTKAMQLLLVGCTSSPQPADIGLLTCHCLRQAEWVKQIYPFRDTFCAQHTSRGSGYLLAVTQKHTHGMVTLAMQQKDFEAPREHNIHKADSR